MGGAGLDDDDGRIGRVEDGFPAPRLNPERVSQMPRMDTVALIKDLDHRVSKIEQILPTLPTKEEVRELVHAVVQEAIAPLPTREDIRTLATREELKAEGALTRSHIDAVMESVRDSVKVIAEGHMHLSGRMDALESSVARDKARVDQRLLRLEARKER